MTRIRLLTFDAFGTLFTPKTSIGKQYVEVALRYGLQDLKPPLVDGSFRKAFKEELRKHPNYGKAVGMKASDWWANVIRSTFLPFTSAPLPEPIISHLLKRFSSAQGYKLQPQVRGFFQQLRDFKKSTSDDPLTIGVITNSDDRVPSVLSSLGLRVDNCRYGTLSPIPDPLDSDINFVIMSYDVGFEKPDPRIFDAARKLGSIVNGRNLEPSECLHVGDNVTKDLRAAEEGGWKAFLMNPDSNPAGLEINLAFLIGLLQSNDEL